MLTSSADIIIGSNIAPGSSSVGLRVVPHNSKQEYPMSKSSFVDFKAVKSAITMEQVLQHYGLLDQFKRSGDNLSGACPIHKGSNPTQFRVSLSKNIWNCFGECKHGGNVLDFIHGLEGGTIHAAAVKAIEWFGIDYPDTSGNSQENPKDAKPPIEKPSGQRIEAAENNSSNKPLKFRLEKL